MTRVLHVVKVAGVSGAENHLLMLLPALRERGFDIRVVMLHEDEPGAHEFASRLGADGVPVEGLRLTHALSPIVLTRLVRSIRSHRPAILHTHLVHADFHGLPAGRLARVPVLVSTKHGFNPFRDGRVFATGGSHSRAARGRPRRDLRGAGVVPRAARGVLRGELRDRPLRDRARPGATASAG